MPIELRKGMEIIKTCILYLSFFTVGMVISLTGPGLLDLQCMVNMDNQHIAIVYTCQGAVMSLTGSCLLDLQHMVRTDTHHIAMVYTCRSSGYLLGAIIGAVIFDLTRLKQAVLTGCNLFITITMFGIPWCRNVEILLALMCINGFCLGALETGGNVICLQLWGKGSNPYFQGMHFVAGMGGLLSPLIAAPFLENIKELPRSMDNSMENITYSKEEFVNFAANFSDFSTNITHFSEGIPKIVYPFSILGIIALLGTILSLGACVISPTEDESPKDDTKIDTSERSLLFMFFLFILTFVAFFIVTGSEIGYGQTLTIFSVKSSLHLTTARGSYITSEFWASFCVSRLFGVLLSMKISCLKLLIGDLVLVAIASLLLLFLMPNEWALWLASVIYGTGIASLYASFVGWINTHITITNKLSAVSSIGCAAGEMVIPFVITYFIDIIPEMFSFSIASSVILTTILLFIFYCMFKSGRKTKRPENVECYVIDGIETKY